MAKKRKQWLLHDFDTTNDAKIQALIGKYGGLGYGIFWRIVEMLHTEPTHKVSMKPYISLAIAQQMLTSAEQVDEIIRFMITDCELFISDDQELWSNRVNDVFYRSEDLSEKRAMAGSGASKTEESIVIPSWINNDLWTAFIDMRKDIKKPPTNTAIKLLVNKLERFKKTGYDIDEIIKNSITNNWQDLYEPKYRLVKKEAWER